MSTAWGLLSQSAAERLGWTLLHSLWQGALVAVLFALLRLFLHRCSSNVRYAAACAMLVLLAAAPLATAFYGPIRINLPGFGQADTSTFSPTTTSAAQFVPAPHSRLVDNAALWLSQCGRFLDRSLPSVVTGWAFGVALLSARWLQGWWWLRRVRRVQVEPLEPRWIAVLEYLKCRFEIRRPVRLVRSTLADVPMVVGWFRPMILLPASTLSGLTPDQIEAILAHELAHVRRYDYVVNALQNVVETLLFYHPAVWWISHCIREERENCCDDLVVRVCHDRLVYARALYRLEELRGAPARLAIAATGGSLLQRVRRLVNGAPEAWPVTAREFGGLTLLAIGCVLLLTGACLMFGPESYSGTVRIRVERERPVYSPGSAPGVTGSYDPYFIQTEFEVLQSQLILGKVIADLDLNREWGKRLHMVLKTEDTIELLKRQLDLRPVRNTSIIEIRVQDEDPAEAAEVANAIARVYTDYRAGKQENGSGKGAGSLVTQMKEQDALAAQAQAKVDALRKQLNLSEASSTDSSPSLLLSAETLRRVEALRLESQAEYIRTRSLLEAFRKLPLEDLIQALPTTGIQDVNLNELVAQRNLIEQRLVATEKEFGPQYSEVVKLKAQAEDLRRKVKYRAEGILGGLDARVSSLRQGLDDLNKEIANALQSEQQTAAASRPYLDAQRELEERQRFRQMLALKIAEEKTDLQLPRNSPVEIVDPAHASTRPSSPNRPRAVGLMVSGLFLCLVGLLLARSGRNQAMELASS